MFRKIHSFRHPYYMRNSIDFMKGIYIHCKKILVSHIFNELVGKYYIRCGIIYKILELQEIIFFDINLYQKHWGCCKLYKMIFFPKKWKTIVGMLQTIHNDIYSEKIEKYEYCYIIWKKDSHNLYFCQKGLW